MAKTLFTGIVVFLAIAASIGLAVLSLAYWKIELEGQEGWIVSTAIALSVCVSLLVGGTAFLAGRVSGWILVATAIFFAGDVYQNAMGYQAFQGLTVSGEVEAAQSRLDQARADLAALPMPNATGAIRKASTWETVNTTLTGRVEAAQAELTALTTPKANDTYVMAAMGLIQIALSVLFGCLGRGAKPEPEAVQVEQEVQASDNVVILQPKRMDDKDAQAWAKLIAK